MVDNSRQIEHAVLDIEFLVKEHLSLSGRIVPDIFFLAFPRIAGQHVFGDSACRYPAHFLRIGFQQGIHEFVCDWDTCPHLSAFSDGTQFYEVPCIKISSVFIFVGYDCSFRYHHFMYVFCQFIHDVYKLLVTCSTNFSNHFSNRSGYLSGLKSSSVSGVMKVNDTGVWLYVS